MAAGQLYNLIHLTCYGINYHDNVIRYMQGHELLASECKCTHCPDTEMERKPFARNKDGYIWRCPNRDCRAQRSIRHGSFFQHSNVDLKTWLMVLYHWANETPVSKTRENCGLSMVTAIQMYQYIRDACSWKLQQTPIRLGGIGPVHPNIVEIDESCFSHKPKHHRGRAPEDPIWVFGMVDTSHQPALGFMRVVERRDAPTLLPIIQQHVLPGTVIHSDEWRAYRHVAALPPVAAHQTVNHSVQFVDPATGVHTQHIESYWNRVKTKLKQMKGCHRHMLPSYLDEFMWRERHGASHVTAFANIMHSISEWYPVP